MASKNKNSKRTIKIHRGTVDRIVSTAGLVIAAGLVFLSGSLLWAHNFIHSQVVEQLSAQRIEFPADDSPAFRALDVEDQKAIKPYAGQQLTTGAGAEAFANHYIAAHLRGIGEGKSYSELSNESRANPDDKELAAKVDQVFRGESLRGVLLNAYAFDTMAVVAKIIAQGALVVAAILTVLAVLGFRHARKVERA